MKNDKADSSDQNRNAAHGGENRYADNPNSPNSENKAESGTYSSMGLKDSIEQCKNVKDAVTSLLHGVTEPIRKVIQQGGNNAELQARVQAIIIGVDQDATELATCIASKEAQKSKAA